MLPKKHVEALPHANRLSVYFARHPMLHFSGCIFKSLEKDLAILKQTSRLQGTISNLSPHQKPIIVLMYQLMVADKKLVGYSVQHRPGTFKFIRFPGRYLIAAF